LDHYWTYTRHTLLDYYWTFGTIRLILDLTYTRLTGGRLTITLGTWLQSMQALSLYCTVLHCHLSFIVILYYYMLLRLFTIYAIIKILLHCTQTLHFIYRVRVIYIYIYMVYVCICIYMCIYNIFIRISILTQKPLQHKQKLTVGQYTECQSCPLPSCGHLLKLLYTLLNSILNSQDA